MRRVSGVGHSLKLSTKWHMSSPREAVLPVTGGRYRRPPANLLHFGVVGAPVEITRVQGFHDVHYLPEQGDREVDGFVIGFGEIFVLGDNSPVSNDSRFWRSGPVVPASLLVGKPFLVHLPGQLVPLKVFGRSFCWVPDPRQIRYIR